VDDETQASLKEDLKQAEKTLLALSNITSLSSDELGDCFVAIPTGQKTFHHGVMVNAFFKIANTLTDANNTKLGEDDKPRTRASFKTSKGDPNGVKALKLYLKGIWDRAGDPQKLTIQNALKIKLETAVKTFKSKIQGSDKDKAPVKGPSQQALIIRAFADPSNRAHVDRAQSKLPDAMRPNMLGANMSEQCALYQFKDLVEAALQKKASYCREDLKESVVGTDFYNFVKDLNPTAASFDMSDDAAQIKTCLEVKSMMTTISTRIAVLQGKVEASGFNKKPPDPEYWQKAFEKETDLSKGTSDPIAAYGLFFFYDKNIKAFGGSLPPPCPNGGRSKSHGPNTIDRRRNSFSDGDGPPGPPGGRASPSVALMMIADASQRNISLQERTEESRVSVLRTQRVQMLLDACHRTLNDPTRLQLAMRENETVEQVTQRLKRKYTQLSDELLGTEE
jgi:hypothetical protein